MRSNPRAQPDRLLRHVHDDKRGRDLGVLRLQGRRVAPLRTAPACHCFWHAVLLSPPALPLLALPRLASPCLALPRLASPRRCFASRCQLPHASSLPPPRLPQELCTFGWIHTHPSQSCFLSSVDLHTQCGYQSVLDEAIAIVLAPSHSPSEGCFRLCHPSPPGLAELQRCRKKGFHPDHQRNGQNAGNGVYEHCAHVRWDTASTLMVVDMRR